jgi:5-methylcytosine-specific restriction endonuclease McrA
MDGGRPAGRPPLCLGAWAPGAEPGSPPTAVDIVEVLSPHRRTVSGGRCEIAQRTHRWSAVPQQTWTDAELRSALGGAKTWSDVCRSLGLAPGGESRRRLRQRAEALGLPVDHLITGPGGAARRRWTDEDLRRAVDRSTNLHEVFKSLGLVVGGGSWVAMQEHIVRLRLDTSHWREGAIQPGRPRSALAHGDWTDGEVRDAYEGARSVAQIMRRLGLDPTRKRGRRQLERRLEGLGLDTSALLGKRWAQGTKPRSRARPLAEILVAGSDYRSVHTLKKRLVQEGLLEPRCAICGLVEWLEQPVVLHLDHINGDRTDHRLENLRFLCPNCHSQTDTYCGRNRSGR